MNRWVNPPRMKTENEFPPIVKKKRITDKRLTKRYEPRIYNFGLRFIDKTLVKSIVG